MSAYTDGKAAVLYWSDEFNLTIVSQEENKIVLRGEKGSITAEWNGAAWSVESEVPAYKNALVKALVSEPVESPKTAIKPARHTSTHPATRNAANGQIMKPTAELTIEDIKSYICQDATDQEAYVFLQLCQARRLNPFLKEAYLIKYGGKASMVVGKDAFTRRAEEHPAFDGFQAGIIVEFQNGEIDFAREGTFLKKGEILLGGWAVVHRKDRAHPFKAAVSLEEYGGKKGGVWSEKPATMIRKVALVQALREAFPSEFSGMYDSAEMGMEAEP